MEKKEIIDGLRNLGLKKGDIVMLHSALSSLGYVEGGADMVVDAFLEVLGKQGTLIVPAFGSLGAIPDAVQEKPDMVKSVHPTAAVAAIGGKADEICRDHWKADTGHGEGTPYTRMAEMGGYIVLLGVDFDRCTLCHTPETLEKLPYLRSVTTSITTPEGEVEKTWHYIPGPHRDFIGLDPILRKSGKLTISKIGSSVVRIIRAKDLIDIMRKTLQKDQKAVLCDNPNCGDCVTQRSAIINHWLSKEDFTLSVSSSLAGSHLHEMIENMKKYRLNCIELDYIKGKEITDISSESIGEYRNELEGEGIIITSLRTNRNSKKTIALIDKAKENDIQNVVMPVTAEMDRYINKAQENGVTVFFENYARSIDNLSGLFIKYKELKPQLAFNPSHFVFIGEKLFSKVYSRTPLRKFIGRLYINDGLFKNEYTGLACGNAEIKELVSILRCRSFSGEMVLDRSLKQVGNFKKAAEDFLERILKKI